METVLRAIVVPGAAKTAGIRFEADVLLASLRFPRLGSDDDSDHHADNDAKGAVDQSNPKERRNHTNNTAAGRGEYVEKTLQRIRLLFAQWIVHFHVSYS